MSGFNYSKVVNIEADLLHLRSVAIGKVVIDEVELKYLKNLFNLYFMPINFPEKELRAYRNRADSPIWGLEIVSGYRRYINPSESSYSSLLAAVFDDYIYPASRYVIDAAVEKMRIVTLSSAWLDVIETISDWPFALGESSFSEVVNFCLMEQNHGQSMAKISFKVKKGGS